MAFRPGSLSERLRILQSRSQCVRNGLFGKTWVTESPFCGQNVQFIDKIAGLALASVQCADVEMVGAGKIGLRMV